MNNTNLKIH